MTHIFRRLSAVAGIAVSALLLTSVSLAQSWSAPAAQLAGNIAEISGPGTAHLSYRNASSLAASQFQDFTRELENGLRGRGLRLVTGGAAVDVSVTASENDRGYVFVAQVQQGRDMRTALVMTPRQSSSLSPGGGAVVTLKKALLVEQDEPILDALVLDANGTPSQLILLGTAHVSALKRSGDQWLPQSSYELQPARPIPLDARGRLVPATGHAFDAYLPGTVCSSTSTSPVVMSCRAADDPWPIGEQQSAFFNGARNFFSGVLSPGLGSQANVEAFYSAVVLPRPGYALWVFTGVDGRVRLADGKDVSTIRANAASREWGSDIASVNGCGRGPLILATGDGDATVTDTIRGYEMPDREPVAVSAAIDMPGPITALWAQPDRRSAVAVVRALATGKYNAYTVSVTCNQ
jgi:hypothetical protein